MDSTPGVGRIVHYLSHGSPILEDGTQRYKPECRAAIVTGNTMGFMDVPLIQLAVLNPSGMFFDTCQHDESKSLGGGWHWPERQ